MTEPTLLKILSYLWAAFGLYWVASAVRGREGGAKAGFTSEPTEPPWYRPLRLAILALTFFLVFSSSLAKSVLGRRFAPPTPYVGDAGFLLAVAGLLLAVWARIHLGPYWSDRIRLKTGHRLVSSGPYRWLRHPIYSGVLAGVLGSTMVLGEWRGVLAFALLLSNYWIKAWREERILAAHFGDAFRDHRTRTGFLLPRFFSRGQGSD